MKVKTDYVPEKSKHLITPGKEYKIIKDECEFSGGIIDDKGNKIHLFYPLCAYLDDRPWTIISETDETDTLTIPLDVIGLPIITNEMKTEFIGEFSFDVEGDYDHETDEYDWIKVIVPWDVCKEIYQRMTIAASKGEKS